MTSVVSVQTGDQKVVLSVVGLHKSTDIDIILKMAGNFQHDFVAELY